MYDQITQTADNRFRISINQTQLDDPELFSESIKSIVEVAKSDISIYIDMEHVSYLSEEAFNMLYNLAYTIHEKQAKLFFTDVIPELDERLSLLTNTE